MQLRPYQTLGVNTLYNALAVEPNVLCVMGTGMGKTELFIALAKKAGVKTAVLVGRNRLVSQTVARMLPHFNDVGVWSAEQGIKRVGSDITVVSIHSADTLTIAGLRFIICDEAHNMNDGRYARFMERHSDAKLAGFTATPWRNGIEIFGEGKTFSRVHFKRGILKGIEDGYLVPPVSKSMPVGYRTEGLKVRGDDFILSEVNKLVMDKAKIRDQVQDAMARVHDRKKVVWMCASIEHAELVAKNIPETSSIVHSKQTNNDYQMECFENGSVRHLVSVMMLSEGYDFPAIDTIILMRPTRSPTLYVQIVGRGLRPAEGKKDCLVLDYGEVVKNCGPLHDPYTRKGRTSSGKREAMQITMRVCPKCLSYVTSEQDECPDCGHEVRQERDPTKSLKRKAGDINILGDREPERLTCYGVTASKHKSKNNNDCIKLSFDVGKTWPINVYGSIHPYSWGKVRSMINKLTPWQFSDWQECYDACTELVFDVPEWVEVEINNGFETVKRISNRTRNPDDARKEQDGLLLEEHIGRIP